MQFDLFTGAEPSWQDKFDKEGPSFMSLTRAIYTKS